MFFIFAVYFLESCKRQRTQGQQYRRPDCAEKAGKSPDNLKVDADHRNAQQEEGKLIEL
jgi:hypothetical protein